MPIRAPISRRRSTLAERPALALLLSLACGVGGATATANDDPLRQGEILVNGLVARATAVHDYYPPEKRRKGQSGRASLAYSVDANGRVVRVYALVSDDPVFEPYAAQVLADLRFKVPPDWAASGGPWRRFRIQVTFTIEGQPPLPVWAQGESVILITGSMSRGH